MGSSTSVFSAQTKLILAITAIVALLIAIGGLVFTIIYKRKVLAKYKNYDEEAEYEKLKIKNPNYGVILNDLKMHYRHPAPDFLVAFLTNSIYLNNFERAFIEDNSDYLTTSLASLAPQCQIELKKEDNFEQKRFYFEEQTKDLKIKEISEPTNKYDLIISFNQNLSVQKNIELYLPHLALQGMFMLFFNKIKEIKALSPYLKKMSLRHETIKFDQKNAILVAKDLQTELANN